MLTMKDDKPEKRLRQRIPVRLPVSIKSHDGLVQSTAHTRDLSSAGVFLYTDSQISEGAAFEMVLVLPAELTFGERRWICCQASVVRVDGQNEQGNFGIAAKIDRFELLPEI
jgi:PilZ domain